MKATQQIPGMIHRAIGVPQKKRVPQKGKSSKQMATKRSKY